MAEALGLGYRHLTPKASSREHLDANLAVFDFELSEEDMRRVHGCAREGRLTDPEFAPAWRT